ncbi:hypothetical protein WJX73_003679 [Symbiochloris irregularis]|uniref:XPA C-terminal domain-containing protein n=1 Tax=Symbiochloris irregularis TaxID=706552 RepID=A0AAW1NPK6_9CHLO
MGDGPPLRDQCQGCSSLSYDQEWQRAFGVKLCLMCKANDDLVSKGHAKELFQLTDADFKKLGSLSKANPRHKDWTAMRLYLQSQVEAAAHKKYGSAEGIEEHRRSQLEARLEAKAKKRTRTLQADAKEADKLARIRRRIETDAGPLVASSGQLAGTEGRRELAQGVVEEL